MIIPARDPATLRADFELLRAVDVGGTYGYAAHVPAGMIVEVERLYSAHDHRMFERTGNRTVWVRFPGARRSLSLRIPATYLEMQASS